MLVEINRQTKEEQEQHKKQLSKRIIQEGIYIQWVQKMTKLESEQMTKLLLAK